MKFSLVFLPIVLFTKVSQWSHIFLSVFLHTTLSVVELLDHSADLTNVACLLVNTVAVVPCPVEDPEHLHTVLIMASVVGLIVVPIHVRHGLVVGLPIPLAFCVLVCTAGPKVTVPCVCRKIYVFKNIYFYSTSYRHKVPLFWKSQCLVCAENICIS